MPLPDSESVYVIPGSILLWKITPRPPNSAQVSYASAYWKCMLPCYSVCSTQSKSLCLSLTSLVFPVCCNKLSHCNCNSGVGGITATGMTLELAEFLWKNGMLCIASSMGAFPTSSLYPAPPARDLLCEKSLPKGFIRGQTLPRRCLRSLRSLNWCVKGWRVSGWNTRVCVQLGRQRIRTRKGALSGLIKGERSLQR